MQAATASRRGVGARAVPRWYTRMQLAGCAIVAPRQQLHQQQQARSKCVKTQASADSAPGATPAAQTLTKVELQTITYNGQKAYYLVPQVPAKGVVLFLHGFAQSPKAYALLYTQLAEEGLLVVAPDPRPMFSLSTQKLQGAITKSAAFWQEQLWNNSLTQFKLPSTAVARNMALLGHSVGAGVATYVAAEAAKGKCFSKRPYKAVMFMAPQTQVYKTFLPAHAITAWSQLGPDVKATRFALQYGYADIIAPFFLAKCLEEELQNLKPGGVQVTPVDSYILGTHVGFEDQLFIGDADVDDQLLPLVGTLLVVLTVAIMLGLRGVNVLPILRFLLRIFSPREKGQQLQQQEKKSLPLDPKAVLSMPSRRAAAAAATAPVGLQEAGMAADEGLSAGEKALLLLQLALAVDDFEAKQQPLPASKTVVEGVETVSILPPEQSWLRYFKLLLLPSLGLYGTTALASQLTEGGWHWLFWLLSLLFGVLSAGGVAALGVQIYVEKRQRPQARANAAQYFKGVLTPQPQPKQP